MATVSSGPARAGHIPAVQGLRAVAIVLVVAYHAGLPVPGGFVGVDVFFVISGFVITRLLLRGVEADGRMNFRRFYRRRVRRLLPALSVMLTVVLLSSVLIASPINAQSDIAVTGVGASLWLANVALFVVTSGYFAPDAHFAVLLHTWSLAVEEQFYVVFPTIVGISHAVARRIKAKPRIVMSVAIVVVFVLSFLINLWLCYAQPAVLVAPVGAAFFFPFGRAWEFAAGALLALVGGKISRLPLPVASTSAVAGAAICLATGLLLHDTVLFPGIVVVLPVLATVLLIAGVTGGQGPVARLLSLRPVTFVGDISYSVYLWHWPLIAFGIQLFGDGMWIRVAGAVVSLPVAWLSYSRVERPLRVRRGARVRTRVRGVVAMSLICPLAAAAFLHQGAAGAWGNARVRDIRAQIDPRTYLEDVCDAGSSSFEGIQICDREVPGSGVPIILLGDSNAQQYGNALSAAAESLHRTIKAAVSPGCAFIDADIVSDQVRHGQCRGHNQALLRWLATQPPSVVVVASANAFVNEPGVTLIEPSGARATTVAAKARVWQQGLESIFRAVQRDGNVVVQVTAMPHLLDDDVAWSPSSCSMPMLTFHQQLCNREISIAQGDAGHAEGLAAERAAAAANGVLTLDLRSQICPKGVCSARWGDFWVYREGMHLTEGMSATLSPEFEAMVRRASKDVGGGATRG